MVPVCPNGQEPQHDPYRLYRADTLIDTDDLANLVVAHYESLDLEGRALLPLIRVYWPAE